jgi:hypothetical protein
LQKQGFDDFQTRQMIGQYYWVIWGYET